MRQDLKINEKLRKHLTYLALNLCFDKNEMMKATFVKTDFKVQAFAITKIMFDDSDLVSLEVNVRLGADFMTTCFLFSFALFNDLLRFSGQQGEQLQLLVSDLLLGKEPGPYCIDRKLNPIVISSCQLELAYIIEQDSSCLSVESLQPISLIQQARNLRANIRDFANVQLQPGESFNQALQEMATMYRYFQGLLELNLTEEHAREKSGLQNDKLFQLAFNASKSLK